MAYKKENGRVRAIVEALQRYLEDGVPSRLEASGDNDEIDALSGAINRLVERSEGILAENKRIEAGLKKSEERYRRLEANIPGHVYVFAVGPDGSPVFRYASQGSIPMYNITPEDLVRDASILLKWLHPDDKERYRTSIKASGETLGPWREMLRFIINGDVRWYDCMARPELQPDGGILWHGIALETTDYMRAMEMLKESEQQLSDIILASPIGIAIYDNSGGCIIANEAIANSIGTTRDEMLTHNYHRLESWRQSGLLDMATEAVRRQVTNHRELEISSTFGKRVIFDCYLVPLGAKGLLIMFHDITKRKRSERALKESYAVLKGVLESPRGVVIFALDRKYRYVAFNKSHQQTMKHIWGADIALGNSMLDYIKDPQDREKARYNFDRALSGESFTVMEEYGATDLERRYYEDIYNPIMDENNSVVGLTLFLTDITDRRHSEEEREMLQAQLNQSQKMESIGRLAGGVAHDFNNMLSVIIGYSELSIKKIHAKDPIYVNLHEVIKAAKRSADLTRQLLAFARKQTVSPKHLDLNETLEGTLNMLRRLIGEDIEVTWSPYAGALPVYMDPSQIDQILTNLCVNARDAISGVGNITIETHAVTFDKGGSPELQEVAPGRYVLLVISDSGCGMDRETMDRIFEPFFTTKESGKGTGLGLATIYGIVKQNNGYVYVRSEPGQGASFSIYLPMHTTEAEGEEDVSPHASAAPGHETILLVEDEQSILDIARYMLEGMGYLVLAAKSPGEAIQLAGAHEGEIHLVITDVVMPEMNGPDLADRILSMYPKMERLFMSGYTGDVIAQQRIQDDGFHFIHKPFSTDELANRVRRLLYKRKTINRSQPG